MRGIFRSVEHGATLHVSVYLPRYLLPTYLSKVPRLASDLKSLFRGLLYHPLFPFQYKRPHCFGQASKIIRRGNEVASVTLPPPQQSMHASQDSIYFNSVLFSFFSCYSQPVAGQQLMFVISCSCSFYVLYALRATYVRSLPAM